MAKAWKHEDGRCLRFPGSSCAACQDPMGVTAPLRSKGSAAVLGLVPRAEDLPVAVFLPELGFDFHDPGGSPLGTALLEEIRSEPNVGPRRVAALQGDPEIRDLRPEAKLLRLGIALREEELEQEALHFFPRDVDDFLREVLAEARDGPAGCSGPPLAIGATSSAARIRPTGNGIRTSVLDVAGPD